MQSVKPWASSEDIAKGTQGVHEITQKLAKVNFGIVCLTPSNLHNQWIHFESGALSKNLDNSALWTLLLDLHPTDVKPPLGNFQHTRTIKQDVFKLIQATNAKTEKPLSEELLSNTFEAFWPKLEDAFANLPSDSMPAPSARPERELLEEILSTLRSQSQNSSSESVPELKYRRLYALIGFADGFMRGSKVDGVVNGTMQGADLLIRIKHLGKELEAVIPINDFAEARARVEKFIANETISDNEIPF